MLSLQCIQSELDFIKAAPQQTNSISYNRNQPEMTLPGLEDVTESSQQMATHNHRPYGIGLMSSTAVWVPTYFTKCFHFTGSMPHYFNIAYTKAQCCGLLITASVRPFLTFYLITGWNLPTLLMFCHAKFTQNNKDKNLFSSICLLKAKVTL